YILALSYLWFFWSFLTAPHFYYPLFEITQRLPTSFFCDSNVMFFNVFFIPHFLGYIQVGKWGITFQFC
ncbi:TPA: hypothetical protein ACUK3M_004776, partial [Escherichia coli]|nr:hypothetical protein [Escherichia coli]